jgi:DNA-binding beta-propeller fold protein YncE
LPSKTVYAAVALCCAGIVTVTAQSAVPLKLKQTIPLSGVEGRIDHFAFDPAGERLFVCALSNNTVEVLDLHKGERVYSITSLGAPQGVAYVPDLIASLLQMTKAVFAGSTTENHSRLWAN